MTSFLDKINSKLNAGRPLKPVDNGILVAPGKMPPPGSPAAAVAPMPSDEELANTQRLNIDVYQTPTAIIIYALIGGAGPEDIDITLDEENDLLTVHGKRKRPEVEKPQDPKDEGKFLLTENVWEPFYRKIVLPTEVDAVKAEALLKKGILTIRLPILKLGEGRKLSVIEVPSANP